MSRSRCRRIRAPGKYEIFSRVGALIFAWIAKIISDCLAPTYPRENGVEFSIKSGSPERIRAGCVIVGVFEPRKLTPAGAALDRATRGQLAAALKRGDMEGKPGTTLILHHLPRVAAA